MRVRAPTTANRSDCCLSGGRLSEATPFTVRPAEPWESPCPTEVRSRVSDSANGGEHQLAAEEVSLPRSDPPESVPAHREPTPDYSPRSPYRRDVRRSRYESQWSPDYSPPEYSPPSLYRYSDWLAYRSQLSYDASRRSRSPYRRSTYDDWPSPDRGRSSSFDTGHRRSRSATRRYPGHDSRSPSPYRADRGGSRHNRLPSPVVILRSRASGHSHDSRSRSEAGQAAESSPRSPAVQEQPRSVTNLALESSPHVPSPREELQCEARRSPDTNSPQPSSHKRHRSASPASAGSPDARSDAGGGDEGSDSEDRRSRSYTPRPPSCGRGMGDRPQRCGGRMPFNDEAHTPATETPAWRHW